MGLKAIVTGATGLVGNRLIRILLDDMRFESVHVLVRRRSGFVHPKFTEYLINFEKPEEWEHLVGGDVLFSAMGTTLSKAGSKENQYRVDFTYQYQVAQAASKNGVSDFVLVSSAGAKRDSVFFYTQMKGQLEEAVQKLNFQRIFIMRPSFLMGTRQEIRQSEKVIQVFATVMTRIFFRKYRPIRARMVAQAMINAVFFNDDVRGTVIYEPGELFYLATR